MDSHGSIVSLVGLLGVLSRFDNLSYNDKNQELGLILPLAREVSQADYSCR